MAMDLFGDLESLGIKKAVDDDIYKEEETAMTRKPQEAVKEEKVINEADLIFDKTMKCPVCDKEFKTKKVRAGKARFIGHDSDLRPLHDGIDTVKYDAIVCTNCGYASLERVFSNVTSMQVKEIKEKVTATFKGIKYDEGTYSYEEALQRYKLALYNCVVRKLKSSEKAYVCLKIAWLYRGMQGLLTDDVGDATLKKDYRLAETAFIQKAYEGFKMAITKESMPICGMDNDTLNFLLADLGRQCGDYDNAAKFAYEIIGSRASSSKHKDKARELYDRIKEEKAAGAKG
jgi:hypothetical protein